MTLRGALLGGGNIAQFGHIPAYAAVSDGGKRCQLVAAADFRQENLAQLEQLVPGIRTYTSVKQLLEEVQPDFVDICAPPHAHRELIELSLAARCHILCEKPLCQTVEDAIAIAEAVRATSLVFMPGHQYHFAPAWTSIRSAISAGAIGAPRLGAVAIERLHANAGNAHWNPTWRTEEAFSGGGILMDHGTHLFYQLRAAFGDPVQVAARIETRRHYPYEVEDTACCYLDFGKMVVRVSLTWASSRRRTVHRYFGTRGRIDCLDSTVELSSQAGSCTLFAGEGLSADSSHSGWYGPLLAEFLGRVEHRDPDRRPLDEAIATLRCIAAAYESAALGRPVQLAVPPG